MASTWIQVKNGCIAMKSMSERLKASQIIATQLKRTRPHIIKGIGTQRYRKNNAVITVEIQQ